MEWAKYRELCDSSNVFSRWALEQTKSQLEPPKRRLIEQVLTNAPIEKPNDHKGDDRTDMFPLSLDQETIGEIIDALRRAESLNKQTTGEVVRGYGGLIKAWEEYQAKHGM